MDGMWEGVSRVRGHKYVYGSFAWTYDKSNRYCHCLQTDRPVGGVTLSPPSFISASRLLHITGFRAAPRVSAQVPRWAHGHPHEVLGGTGHTRRGRPRGPLSPMGTSIWFLFSGTRTPAAVCSGTVGARLPASITGTPRAGGPMVLHPPGASAPPATPASYTRRSAGSGPNLARGPARAVPTCYTESRPLGP